MNGLVLDKAHMISHVFVRVDNKSLVMEMGQHERVKNSWNEGSGKGCSWTTTLDVLLKGRALVDAHTCTGNDMEDGCTVDVQEMVMAGGRKHWRKKHMRAVKVVGFEEAANQQKCRRKTSVGQKDQAGH